jgi:MYXO-CTERM domain-containing protein
MRALTLAGAAMAAGLSAAPAAAQDALRGKRLYLDAARLVGSGVSCVDCHGGLPGGLFGIGRAAGDPARIGNAVDTIPQMAPLRGRLTAMALADLAAYLAEPEVASPQVTLSTSLPGGAPGRADRIDFGAVEVGAGGAAASLRLANSGLLPLTITGAPALAGDDQSDFAIAATSCEPGRALAPGESCEVELHFLPAIGAGVRAARLTVAHDWVSGAAAVALLGTGEDAPPPPPSPSASASGCSSGPGNATAPPVVTLSMVALWMLRRRRADSSCGSDEPRQVGAERRATRRRRQGKEARMPPIVIPSGPMSNAALPWQKPIVPSNLPPPSASSTSVSLGHFATGPLGSWERSRRPR